jgi:predicted neutral ceramidase superfamily lipid hydrolase
MKLNRYQINFIEKKLDRLNVDYLDIKSELTDHIACDIERLMKKEELDFEKASYLVFQNWNEEFVFSKNIFTGYMNSFPKIVLKKILQSAKRLQLFSIICFVVTFLISNFLNNDTKKYLLSGMFLVKSALLIFFLISLICFCILKYRKKKTTFLILFNQSMIGYIMLPFLLLFTIEIGLFFLISYISFMSLINFIYSMRLFYLHNQFILKTSY